MKTQAFKNFVEKLEPWIIGLFLLYFFGLDAPSVFVTLMKVGSYPLLLFLIILRWKRFAYFATRDISLILLVAIAMLSVFWSAAPEVTSIETKAVLRATLFGVYLASRFSIKEQMYLFAWVLGTGAVFSFLFAIAMPSYGIHTSGDSGMIGAWKGIFGFKNLFASIMAITSVLFLVIALNSRRKPWLYWCLFGLAVILLILSKGKTSYSVFFISLCLVPLQKFIKQQYKLRVILILCTLLLGSIILVLFISNLEFIVVDTLGKNLEFNGRLPIWTLIFDKISERPWLGYGMSGFWTSDEGLYVVYNSWADGKSGTRFNAHNGYLDLCLSLGYIGFSLYLFNLVTVVTRTINLWVSIKGAEYFWMIQTLVVLFLLNFSDSISILGTGSMWILYVSIAISTSAQQTQIRRNYQLGKVLTSS